VSLRSGDSRFVASRLLFVRFHVCNERGFHQSEALITNQAIVSLMATLLAPLTPPQSLIIEINDAIRRTTTETNKMRLLFGLSELERQTDGVQI